MSTVNSVIFTPFQIMELVTLLIMSVDETDLGLKKVFIVMNTSKTQSYVKII